MSALASAARRVRDVRTSTLIVATVLAVAVTAGAIFLTSSPGTYPLRAVFTNGQGLFPGAAVRLLGVQVGSVTDVEYSHGAVDVTMQIDGNQQLPAGVHAALISPLLLGQPDIELAPGYTGGPTLAEGAVIPVGRTAVPVSTDELLRQLQRVLGSIKPSSLHNLVGNLATDLSGQGSQLRQLISSASGTLQLLAQKGNDLGRLNGSLAQLTGTLRANENQLLDLVQQYEVVSGVIASHQQALGSSIDLLSKVSAQLAGLLSPNMRPLEQDVAVITTAGRTLDRNLSNLDAIMSSSRALFAGAHRAYEPRYHWLDLNNQMAPGLTASVMEGLVRDRLAGICRRVLAHHSAGLPAAEKATLATCGNPDSGYFNPILGLIPTIIQKGGLNNPGGSPKSPGAGGLLGAGLARIPGLSATQQQQIANAVANGGSSSTTSGSSTGTTHHKKKKKCSSGVDGAIDCVLGPLPTVGVSGTSGSISTSTTLPGTSGGLVGSIFGGIPILDRLGGLW
jgi:phospholipid/cholesterol/gamma-HCH transport system substrate-binding protein